MKSFLTIVALLLAAPVMTAGTLILSGVLSPTEAIGGRGPGDGMFTLRLSGDTLVYSVTTRRIGDAFIVPDAILTLDMPSGEVALEFSAHGAFTVGGCYAFFISTPLSWRYDDPGLIGVPFDVPPPTIECDIVNGISILSGWIQFSPEQIQDFQTPDFQVVFSARPEPSFGESLELFGRTDPNVVVIPEPTSAALLGLSGILVWTVRYSSKRRTSETGEKGQREQLPPLS